MAFFFESPGMILLIGGLTLAIIAGGWYQTQRTELVWSFVAALVVFGGLLLIERSVVTETEKIKYLIHDVAREVERKDIDAFERRFHSTAEKHRAQLRGEMAYYNVRKVDVKNNLKVELNMQGQPPRAVVSFNVVVVIDNPTGGSEITVPRFVTATLWLEDGEWRCVDYAHSDVIAGMQTKE